VFIPLYYKWKVYTAYEFIGKRFDDAHATAHGHPLPDPARTGTGITIYAPSIVLSKVLNWPLSWTCVFIGDAGDHLHHHRRRKAVGVTHKQQMAVMFGGLFVAFGLVVWYLRSTSASARACNWPAPGQDRR
jgi:SSS family solute:Na+ symporter